MDHISARKREVRRDLHLRDDICSPNKRIRSSAFNITKSQGGGIYSTPTKTSMEKTAMHLFIRPSTAAHENGLRSAYVSPASSHLRNGLQTPTRTFRHEEALKLTETFKSRAKSSTGRS
jgi:hypothetical protein